MFAQCKLCNVWLDTGRVQQAEAECARVLHLRSAVFRPDSQDTLEFRRMWHRIERRLGRTEQAAAGFQDVIERCWRTMGPLHQTTQGCARQLTEVLDELGRAGEATAVRRRLVDAVLGAFESIPAKSPFHGCSPRFLEQLLAIDNDGALQGRYLDTLRRVYPDGDARRADGMRILAKQLLPRGRLPEAEALARDAVRCSTADPTAVPVQIMAFGDLARILQQQERLDEALASFEQAQGLAEREHREPNHPLLAADHARCLLALDRHAEAARRVRACQEAITAGGDDRHRVPTDLLNGLVEVYERWHAVAPADGHDAEAAKWRAVLDRAR
jgi:hypothetical protein